MSKTELLDLKYRPSLFRETVGQEHIGSVLRGLIKSKNYTILNSLIYTGTPGGGKTTSARIFAKAVNCLGTIEGEPCNACKNCKDFMDNNYPDYIELDGASYNTVDSAKLLVQIANQYPINPDGYRMITVDEAHRLSNAAWDILLKLLEEGQNKTIFQFATTEPDKIRPAIKSRSFTFVIKPLTARQIEKQLRYICKEEGIEYDKDALKRIAHYNKGKTRDSVKLLDMYYKAYGEVKDIILEIPETNILDALVLAFHGKLDEAYDKLDLLMGQELNLKDSLSKVLIDVWRYPNSFESGVDPDDLQKANNLLGPIVKDLVADFMQYNPSELEAYKLFLILVQEKGTSKQNQGNTQSEVKRRFRDTSKSEAVPVSETKKVKIPKQDAEVYQSSGVERSLKALGFNIHSE